MVNGAKIPQKPVVSATNTKGNKKGVFHQQGRGGYTAWPLFAVIDIVARPEIQYRHGEGGRFIVRDKNPNFSRESKK